MAKQTVLKERGTGKVMYPQTLASLVQTADGGNVDEGLEKAKFALFVDMWNEAWGEYGGYDPVNAPDAEHPFMGNKIWMSYEEALDVWIQAVTQYPNPKPLTRTVRTNIFIETPIYRALSQTSLDNLCAYANCLEAVRVSADNSFVVCSSLTNTFWGCRNLRKVLGEIDVYNVKSLRQCFSNCSSLETIYLKRLSSSLWMPDAKSIDLASLQSLVANAANDTTTITVTVHADVYAKLTGDTTNAAAAALTAEELAAWQQIVTDAVAKNISFATT